MGTRREFDQFVKRKSHSGKRPLPIAPPFDVIALLSDARKTRRRRQLASFIPYIGVAFVAFPILLLSMILYDRYPAQQALRLAGGPNDSLAAQFSTCHFGGGENCVVDGDTFWFKGEKVRIADIDTPETHPSRCADEAEKGDAATQRLKALLNAGPFSLVPIERNLDRYGRKLRIVQRDGQSLGRTLVSEGLARSYSGGYRASWCV
jgi:micrococcal nuclease